MARNSDILVIIPAFNEEATLEKTIDELATQTDYDYIIINDGSSDLTGAIIQQGGYPSLHHPINLGIGGSMQSGYKYAARHGYQYAIQMDADGQHRAADLCQLVAAIRSSGADMVIGSRFVEKSSYAGSKIRRLGIWYFQWLIRFLTGIDIYDPTSGFRIINRKTIELFAQSYPSDYPEVEVLVSLSKQKRQLQEISVEMRSRQGGTSSINWSRSVYYMLKVSLFSLIRKGFS